MWAILLPWPLLLPGRRLLKQVLLCLLTVGLAGNAQAQQGGGDAPPAFTPPPQEQPADKQPPETKSAGIPAASPSALREETLPPNTDSAPEAAVTEAQKTAAEHYKRARVEIAGKNWEGAISELEQALKFTPENGAYHHALGVAYMGDQQPNAGWFHFRQAVRLAPNYQPAVVDFMKTWKLLDAQGVFNVGTPLPLVAQTLGKPDQADDAGSRIRLVYGFMSLNFMNSQLFSILDLRNLPPEGLAAADGLAFQLERDDWQVAYRILTASQGNTEYVRKGETLQRWTELFASQRFIGAAKEKHASEVMEGVRKRLEQTFPDVKFEVLEANEEAALFQWSITQTDQHPAQQELVRLARGAQDIHRLSYTQKGEQTDPKNWESWVTLLREAELMPAEKLREHLLNEEVKLQEEQLRDISVQILKKQFEMIRSGKIDELKVFFTTQVRDKVTPELLAQVAPELEKLNPELLVDEVDLVVGKEPVRARLLTKEGEVFTTLVQLQGRWYAENVWLEDMLKK